MIIESHKGGIMKTFKAVYQCGDKETFSYSLLSTDLSKATLAAAELKPRNTVLVKVFHNPDW